MTLLAALLLASCAPSHSTNNQTSASSTEVAKKNEISITISDARRSKAQSKTLKVAEESNLMKVLKANYKIEEKNGMITSIDGHAKMKPKVFTGCTRSMAKWLQKVLLKPPLKKGDKIEFYQEVYK